jgi:hypothetical protein
MALQAMAQTGGDDGFRRSAKQGAFFPQYFIDIDEGDSRVIARVYVGRGGDHGDRLAGEGYGLEGNADPRGPQIGFFDAAQIRLHLIETFALAGLVGDGEVQFREAARRLETGPPGAIPVQQLPRFRVQAQDDSPVWRAG